MVGKELSPKKGGLIDIREIAAKTTLREVRQKGHTYVELRRDGKRVIFFCTICLTPCYSDNVLFDHLKGNLHARRFSAAKATLFGPVPWPFNDGVLFFGNSRENDKVEHASRSKALVLHSHNKSNGNGDSKHSKKGKLQLALTTTTSNSKTIMSSNRIENSMTIPGVLLKEISNLEVQILGIGSISYKIQEFDEIRSKISKIYCEWIGGDEDITRNNNTNTCDFAVVNFGYTFDLGRKWGSEEELETQITPNSYFTIEDSGRRGKRRKKSFSDQEASSDESQRLTQKEMGMQITVFDESIVDAVASRRELRKQKRLAAERACDICGQPMLSGKDVCALLNMKTRVLACSSRNANGAFHLFHASCLVHWILLCEYEIINDKIKNPKGHRGRKPKLGFKNLISTILCPECQGTGIHVQNDEYEKPSISLSEMFKYKLKAIEAHKAWMKNPEVLENCSTGLSFPNEFFETSQGEKVVSLKKVCFYRADESRD